MSLVAPVLPALQEVTETPTQGRHKLILFNDDVNTFEHVIESLVKICDHSPEQAEQCALIVHYKGKTSVLSGSMEYLTPRCRALENRGLTVQID